MKKDIDIICKEFRRSEEALYIHRLHGVLLVLCGFSTVKAGQILGDPQRTVAHWVAQFRAKGLAGLQDSERSGRPSVLADEQREFIAKAIKSPPKKLGLEATEWTGPLLASVLKKRFDINLSPRQCARILKSLATPTGT